MKGESSHKLGDVVILLSVVSSQTRRKEVIEMCACVCTRVGMDEKTMLSSLQRRV